MVAAVAMEAATSAPCRRSTSSALALTDTVPSRPCRTRTPSPLDRPRSLCSSLDVGTSMNTTEEFWREFQIIEVNLSGGKPSEQAMDNLLSFLLLVDPRLYYHLGSTDAGTDLILSAEGHADLMPILKRLKAAAPQSARWNVVTAFEGMLLFGQRNEKVFPVSENENGDVLFRMANNGDDLFKARDVNFSVVFQEREAAQQFADHFRKLGFEVEIAEPQGLTRRKHDVTVTINMVPSYESITNFEQQLESVAAPLGGKNDGWGCFQQV
jgi:hypothetical protein